MNKQSVMVIRICCVLVFIFAVGIWVGRMTVQPVEKIVYVEPEGSQEAQEELSGNSAADLVSRRVIPRYRAELDLSDEQVAELQPFFLHAGREMSQHQPNSEGRLRAIVRFCGRISPYLDEDQKVKLKKVLERVEKRFAESSD